MEAFAAHEKNILARFKQDTNQAKLRIILLLQFRNRKILQLCNSPSQPPQVFPSISGSHSSSHRAALKSFKASAKWLS
eukprot:1173486-Rhodomonas_salina.1